MSQKFDDLGVLDSYEADVRAEALAAGSDKDHVGHILHFLNFPHTLITKRLPFP